MYRFLLLPLGSFFFPPDGVFSSSSGVENRRLLFFLWCGKPTKTHTSPTIPEDGGTRVRVPRFRPLGHPKKKVAESQKVLAQNTPRVEIYRLVPSVSRQTLGKGWNQQLVPNNFSKHGSFFTAQSLPLARLVQDDGSRELPQIAEGRKLALRALRCELTKRRRKRPYPTP